MSDPTGPRVRTYEETVGYAVLMLVDAVTAAMNREDWPMIEELKRLCLEAFEQAEEARRGHERPHN